MNVKIESRRLLNYETANHLADPLLWVSKYADYLYAYSMERVKNEELARDLVQDTFLSALEKLKDFEGRSSEKTWLTAILKNKIYDNFRSKATVFLKFAISENGTENSRSFFNNDGHWRVSNRPEAFGLEDPDAIGKREFQEILQKCLKKLPAMWLDVFTMRYIDDEKAELICKELKLSASNFWVIIHRAKINLRECLQKNWS